jgi:hypothetical protein
VFEELFDLREALLHQVPHRHEARLDAVIGDRENRTLGFVQNQIGVLIGLVRIGDDLVRRVNQRPQRCLLLDDLGVVLDVGGPRHTVDERRDVGGASDFIELTSAPEFLFERDQVNRLAALRELCHPLEDAPMRVAKKRARIDHRRSDVERVVVDEDGAEDGALRVEVVRERSIRYGGCCEFRHLVGARKGKAGL